MKQSVPNRLLHEPSPYLKQHAWNPIDWFSWGSSAFAKALSENKLVFLSIGYSSCHWCHVMEKEAFSNEEIGGFLNTHFVSIKVDREEHPEVDSLYMDFAQFLIGSGGWPLNLVLTPDLKPLLAATYLPLKAREGLPSFLQFISYAYKLWMSQHRDEMIQSAEEIVKYFKQAEQIKNDYLPTKQFLEDAVKILKPFLDTSHGGFQGSPKFPLSFQTEFLLSWAHLEKDTDLVSYVDLTLKEMQKGGIYDHLGGGFYRYATDEEWLVPHFEKTLYDNALLVRAYLQTWKCTQNLIHLETARSTLDYLERDLMHPEGGFFSAEDADSSGIEGAFYLWDRQDIRAHLPEEDADLFCAFYDVTYQGNFHGKNILHVDLEMEDFAKASLTSKKEIERRLSAARKKLLAVRNQRERPLRDEKILTSWNGLAIDSFAFAASVFPDSSYLESAISAASFIKTYLWKEGHLLHSFCEGQSRFPALLEDYAFMIRGLLTLFEQTASTQWLDWALELSHVLEKEFRTDQGAFYQTDQHHTLLVRKCSFYDGVEPSGNGAHAENLLRLYIITGQIVFLEQAEDLLKNGMFFIQKAAPSALYQLHAAYRYLDLKSGKIVITYEQEEDILPIRQKLASCFLPHYSVIWQKGCGAMSSYPAVQKKPTLYLCTQKGCDVPLTKYEEIVKVIEKL